MSLLILVIERSYSHQAWREASASTPVPERIDRRQRVRQHAIGQEKTVEMIDLSAGRCGPAIPRATIVCAHLWKCSHLPQSTRNAGTSAL